MTVKNLSNKVIGFGTRILMPGATQAGFTNAEVNSAAFKAYERLGLIAVLDAAPAAKVADESGISETPADEPVKKRRTTSKAAEEK